MRIKKNKNDISLEDNNKIVKFIYGGNLDLYWVLYNKNNDGYNSFTITRENYGVYRLFENLFEDIECCNIYDDESLNNWQRVYNKSTYNNLYNKENRTITWYSDETAKDVANYLVIKKEEDIFKLDFYIQTCVDDYDEDFHFDGYIPIRFRNSGSAYDPFNIIFMKMYGNLKYVDDINDVGHQMHIEEYLYEKKRNLVKHRSDYNV